ncbi:hypothetical protein [Roseobacter litoralis]|uniref:hypothetical protein n=1 Tax=Roseobacter litoralis TaxID=42443 RepID=UPI0011D2B72F|nr:hypothetical protein [Roseobacter litoralis]
MTPNLSPASRLNHRGNNGAVTVSQHHRQKNALKALDAKIGKLTDRLIETDSPATIRAYEGKLEKLEAQKALIAENLTKAPTSVSDFDTEFRTAMNFLANPWNLWVSKHPKDRKTLLKLVFASPLPYARKKGFRTAKTTIPFKVLGDLSDPEKEMADRGGFEPPTP